MNYRLRRYYVFIPIVQVAFFIAAYELTNYMAHKMDLVYSRGVAWGISATDYLIKYTLIIIGITIANLAINRIHLLLSAAGAILFAILAFPVLDHYPYRGGLVILIGVLGISISYLCRILFKNRLDSN